VPNTRDLCRQAPNAPQGKVASQFRRHEFGWLIGDHLEKLGSDVPWADTMSASRTVFGVQLPSVPECPPTTSRRYWCRSLEICDLNKTSVRKARTRGMAADLLLFLRDPRLQCDMKRLTADQVKLGFIGLGNMGSRIAQRLLDHGYPLVAYDRDITKAEAVAGKRGFAAKNLLELLRTAEVILSCLTNDESVQTVYTEPAGVFAEARPGTIVLEMSTISPESSRELHRLGAKRGIEVLDVAISGSTPAAERGILTLLAGGNEDLFRAAEPIFQAIAKQYFLLGGPGSGTAMKLVVNTLLGVGMQAIAEAVVLGEKAGLDRKRLLDVLSQTAVIAPAHVGKLARIAIGDYTQQFPLSLMNKDFGLILGAAARANVSMPVTEAAFRVNAEELATGGDEDFSAVLRRMEEVTRIPNLPVSRAI
jgi:3-hydroxyisobutyrate dehydrogenase-like beta-hydroxyacid dehydrogenase